MNDAYKVGAWYDSYNFDEQQYDTMRVPLASPLSNGIPAIHSPNYSIYGLIDKVIWLPKEDPNRYVTVFVRPMFTTLQDRNLISFSVNGGLTLHQPLSGPAVLEAPYPMSPSGTRRSAAGPKRCGAAPTPMSWSWRSPTNWRGSRGRCCGEGSLLPPWDCPRWRNGWSIGLGLLPVPWTPR